MRVSAAIKSLIHGVTTDNLVNADSRYMAEQVNTITRIDEGLTKRPPTELVAEMGASLDADDFVKDFLIHDIAYFLIFRDGVITCYRDDGTEFTVTDAAPDGYLTGVEENDVAITVHGEQVFIVNKNKAVLMEANTDINVYNSMVVVKAAVPQGSWVQINATDDNGTRQSVLITVGSTLAATATDVVAAQIAGALDALANTTASAQGSVVQIVRSTNEYADVTIDSSFGHEDYFVNMNGVVNAYTDLPRFSYHGHITEVKQEGSTEAAPIYMQSVGESYEEVISGSPGVPPAWPSPTWGEFQFKWCNNSGTPNPADDGATATSTYAYLSHYPAALTHEGKTVYRIDIGVYNSTTDEIKAYTIVQFTGGETYPTALNVRIAHQASPNATVYNHEMTLFGFAWHMDDPTYAEPEMYKAIYGMWVGVYEQPAAAASGLIGCRWIEAQAPALQKTIDSTTMPHLFVPHATSDEFSYGATSWDDRRAGDNDSNPLPRFIGNTIEDIVIFQNRLALLTRDEFVASASGNVFNYFRDTVTQLLSKHPVNLRSTSAKSSKLHHFVYHNRDLLITAGRQQYKIDGSIPFAPATASMQLTTSYNASETVAPVSIGNSVYIPNHHGSYLNVNKYDGSNQNLTPDAADNITQHARKYLSGLVNSLAGLPNHGLLFANYSLGQDIYVCNYDTLVSRQEDQRFAWFKWNDFTEEPYSVRAIATVKNTLLAVISTANGLSLVTMDIDSATDKVYLDGQIETTANTTVDVSSTYQHDLEEIVVVQGTGCPSPGDYVDTVSLIAGILTLDTDMEGGTVYVGREFTVQVVPNLVSVRDEGGQVNNSANLRINGFDVRVRDTGKMTATERSPYDTYETQEFTGLVSGSLDAITDQEATTTDIFKIGFKQKADVGTILLESKSWLPMTITQIDWKGNYTARGRRF